jgi:hypothetical protein
MKKINLNRYFKKNGKDGDCRCSYRYCENSTLPFQKSSPAFPEKLACFFEKLACFLKKLACFFEKLACFFVKARLNRQNYIIFRINIFLKHVNPVNIFPLINRLNYIIFRINIFLKHVNPVNCVQRWRGIVKTPKLCVSTIVNYHVSSNTINIYF